MAKLLSTIIDGFLASKNFISGALGSGWKIWKMNGRYKFEVDDVVVRNTMTVFELLISKIRAVKGALGITQASGKIKSVREDADNYYVQIEDEMTFVAHDIIKCQTFSSGQKNYWVIVDSIRVETVGSETISEIVISKSEFSGSSLPEVSDEIVQFGNTTDVRRQSAIYLHADENGVPAIDVLFNINAKTFDGCTKVRIGGDLPNEDGYKGFFCENGLIKSVNESGETIYMLRPDGSGFVAKEAIKWAVDGSGSIGDGAISWRYDKTTQKYVVEMGNNVILTWNNLDEQTKENLKGEGLIVEFSADGEEWHTIFESGDLYQRQKVGNGAWNGPFKIVGQDANLLPWIEEWNSPDNQTEIGGEYVISPKMFSGIKNVDGTLTGVAFGRSVVTVVENGVEKQKTGIFGLKDGKITFSVDKEGNAFYGGEINVNGKFKVDKNGMVTAIGGSFSGNVAMDSGSIGGFNVSEKKIISKEIVNSMAAIVVSPKYIEIHSDSPVSYKINNNTYKSVLVSEVIGGSAYEYRFGILGIGDPTGTIVDNSITYGGGFIGGIFTDGISVTETGFTTQWPSSKYVVIRFTNKTDTVFHTKGMRYKKGQLIWIYNASPNSSNLYIKQDESGDIPIYVDDENKSNLKQDTRGYWCLLQYIHSNRINYLGGDGTKWGN